MTCSRSSNIIRTKQTISTSKSKAVVPQSSARTASRLLIPNTFTVFRRHLQTVRFRGISRIITQTLQIRRMQQSHCRISFRCKWQTKIINSSTTEGLVVQFKTQINKIKTTQRDLHRCKQEICRRIWQK